MSDLPRGDVVRRFARVISGLDVDLYHALVGENATLPALDDAAARSLLALVETLLSPEVGASSVQLHVVVRGGDEGVAPLLEDLIARQLPQGRSNKVVPLVVDEDLGGDLGEQADVFAAGHARGEVEERVPVFLNGAGGPADIRRALAAVADAWGIATLLSADGVVYARRVLGDMTSSRMLEALRFALTKERTPENDVEVLSRGFEGLVRREGTGYAATRTLDALLREERFIGLPDHYSACAELLRRKGQERLADELRRLIDHWVRHRIWSVNYVSEMVLHDETHSAAVDRNVASLCEGLLSAEEPLIEPWDVFVLALCAWLHDWGHASAKVTPTVPTDPEEVRNYHGFLTALRLTQERGQHGITDELIPEAHRQDGLRQLEAEVALLCSHHQGWTSCSDSPPMDEFVPLPNFSVLGADNFAKHDKTLGVHLSFEADFARRLLPTGATCGRDYCRLEQLLAILRLADAADVGVHRVPDYVTQASNRTANHDAFLGRIERMLSLRSSAATLASGAEGSKLADDKAFVNVSNAYQKLITESLSKAVWDEGEVEQFVEEFIVSEGLEHWDTKATSSDTPGEQLVRWAWRYSKHVAKQVAFYQHHHRVRAVIPVLEPAGSLLRIVLNVVPMDRGRLGDTATPEDVARAVARDVVREFSGRLEPGGSRVRVETLKAPHKAHLVGILGTSLGVDTRYIEIRPFATKPAPPDPVPCSSPGPRLVLPGAAGPRDQVRWYAFGADGQVSAPLSSAVDGAGWVTAPRPLAMTSDGLHAAACVGSVLEILDATTGRPVRRLGVGADEGLVLALRRDETAFHVILTAAGEVRRAWIPIGPGRSSADPPSSPTPLPVRAVFVFDEPHFIDSNGVVTGRHAGWLTYGSTAVRSLDAAMLGERVVWALVPMDAPTQVRVMSAGRSAMSAARSEQVLEADGDVAEIAWVREPRDRVARLLVVRKGVPRVHDVAVGE